MSLITPNYFYRSNRGHLGLNLSGKVAVLFFSTVCPHCPLMVKTVQTLRAQFQKRGIELVLIPTDKYPSLIRMADETNLPIDFVPKLVMFRNGIPISVYKGSRDVKSVEQWLGFFV